MLGYTQANNDVYIFFENDEIEKLRCGKIQGTYFNLRDPSMTGQLEASISDKIGMIRMKTSCHKDDDGFMTWFHLEMRSTAYQRFRKRGSFGEHEGFRHVCLRDANKLDFSDKFNYNQLKYWETQNSRTKT